jgi:uncharacterized protein with GYD domain
MPKYLIQASYSAEGLEGLKKDTASGRKAAVTKAMESLGGKVEAFYFSFGSEDVVLIVDMPSNTAAASASIAVGSTGLAHTHTTPLLTVEEADKAITMKADYRAPGK